MGYDQVSWDNGKVKQPASSSRYWHQLTTKEKTAAVNLGYTAITWDNLSGGEKAPASAGKSWAELSSCGKQTCIISALSPNLCLSVHTGRQRLLTACSVFRMQKRGECRESVGVHSSLLGRRVRQRKATVRDQYIVLLPVTRPEGGSYDVGLHRKVLG